MNQLDTDKLIRECTDLTYLETLLTYVDMDIDNIGKDSTVISEMKANMRNLTVEEMEKQQFEELSDLKSKIIKRISEL